MIVPTLSQTREAVYQRLGGQFDYNQCCEDLRQIMSDKEHFERQFRADALKVPEFKDQAFGKVNYDFSSSVFSKEPFSIDAKPYEEKVSFKKPALFNEIATEPKYFLDYEQFKMDGEREK